jgi:hypothetical protein
VDYGVEALPFAANFGKEGRDGVRVGDIHARGAVDGTELSGGFADFFGRGGEPELMAGGGEFAGDFQTDAAAAAGDQDAGGVRRTRDSGHLSGSRNYFSIRT